MHSIHYVCPFYVSNDFGSIILQSYVRYMQGKHNRHNFFYRSNHSAYIIYRVKIDV